MKLKILLGRTSIQRSLLRKAIGMLQTSSMSRLGVVDDRISAWITRLSGHVAI
jgi:hypothetical protein